MPEWHKTRKPPDPQVLCVEVARRRLPDTRAHANTGTAACANANTSGTKASHGLVDGFPFHGRDHGRLHVLHVEQTYRKYQFFSVRTADEIKSYILRSAPGS